MSPNLFFNLQVTAYSIYIYGSLWCIPLKNRVCIVNAYNYATIPDEDYWKVDLLDELLQIRNGDLEFGGNDGLKFDELEALIKWVSSA